MNGEFSSYVIDELRSLLNAWESGKEPYNIVLNAAVTKECRRQYEIEKELREKGI